MTLEARAIRVLLNDAIARFVRSELEYDRGRMDALMAADSLFPIHMKLKPCDPDERAERSTADEQL